MFFNKLSINYLSFFMLFFLSLMFFGLCLKFLVNNLIYLIEWDILSFYSTQMVMVILLDWMSLMFMSLVLFISSLVILYSEEYMYGDINKNRFIFLILLFVLSMIFLIISPNLISILLGWDGLGLTSYCLVIYYQNFKSYNAGMLTVLSNRIGDVLLLMSIGWMINFGSWNYIYYFNLSSYNNELFIIVFMVILASMTKSAQIPFSSWLPAAMAAPTPVSALVHSSTLVTAGIYLLVRFNSLIEGLHLNKFLLMISLLTMFMAGMGANYEYDLKKIIALSTLSQLGLMMSVLAIGGVNLTFFHLIIHALFKALLFLCAGFFIHSMLNNQDIRLMGISSFKMPLVMVIFNFCNLSMCGLPFFSGFYSKDLMMEMFLMMNFNVIVFFFFFFSIGLTVMYSFRLTYYSFLKEINLFSLNNLNENMGWMSKSKIFMFFIMMLSGISLSWLIFPIPEMILLPNFMKFMVLLFVVLGLILGLFMNKLKKNSINLMNYYLGSMWFMPIMSTYLVGNKILLISENLNNLDDWNEYEMVKMINFIDYMFILMNKLMSLNSMKLFFKLMFWYFILLIFLILLVG
uniref:NADH-ubiquinone oxidoreductase chain 5 n=1 Tax=Megalodontes quinquecinctus TaxID=2491145 RepID=A0A3S8V0Y5_9HYME|nr:NADH dehydrogenase subunit 5 [Megalodontes quinquecinctus]